VNSRNINSRVECLTLRNHKSRISPHREQPADRSYSMKVNDDGTVTASFGDITTTFEAQPDENGRARLRAAFESHRGCDHNKTITDGGQKATLTCSCDRFTAILEGYTADIREASVTAAWNEHMSRVENGTNL